MVSGKLRLVALTKVSIETAITSGIPKLQVKAASISMQALDLDWASRAPDKLQKAALKAGDSPDLKSLHDKLADYNIYVATRSEACIFLTIREPIVLTSWCE